MVTWWSHGKTQNFILKTLLQHAMTYRCKYADLVKLKFGNVDNTNSSPSPCEVGETSTSETDTYILLHESKTYEEFDWMHFQKTNFFFSSLY
jgi:hypothetical protein